MNFFSKLLKKEDPSSFLHYMDSATKKKSDSKIYEAIFTRDTDLKEYNDYTIARLRARTGVSLEDAKILLGQ
jgi:hypothetical protein